MVCPIYKGKLNDGKEIAVKRLSSSSGQGIAEFKNEILLISRLQYRNLVRLVGYCTEEENIIVYEYLPNKSLDAFLSDSTEKPKLSWAICFRIIFGVTRGLLYLRRNSFLRVIHQVLKESNILLDEKMNPKISDFGQYLKALKIWLILTKLLGHCKLSIVPLRVVTHEAICHLNSRLAV
ncbi:G-type lectin S-receptor-like serine/threonine-protein kinase B120 [Eucalyptus grandis]|uniref:G-type lectin S-receptor-like serine/threonine-protein kinase B120 n=1 Tax=Eucalyptus grandis TaxID=71139 RepID=UPI00192EECB5|nr:G-type lectin S-receptor-like serine/threonine-protein kinase B120 [Eucalyptus grandis]